MNVSVINDGTNHSGDDLDDPAASFGSDEPTRLSDASSSQEAAASAQHQVVANTPQSPAPPPPPNDRGGGEEEEDPRLQQLRSIIDPDGVMPIEELRDILDQNERASASTRASEPSVASHVSSPSSAVPAMTPSSPPRRHGWEQCRPASSRPGVVNVGGQITGRIFPVGQMDEIELIQRKINAVHQIQGKLKNIDFQSKKQEMERIYEKEKRMVEATRMEQSTEMLAPRVKTWDPPSDELLRNEPALPPPDGEPLPLPSSFAEEGTDSRSSNSEIAVGRLVDPGEDEEEKQEEDISIENKLAEVTTFDDSELGAYDHVVRCWKCRAGLKINIEVGLVVCPRCRSISPTTDVANVG
jgi:hypothetical protein